MSYYLEVRNAAPGFSAPSIRKSWGASFRENLKQASCYETARHSHGGKASCSSYDSREISEGICIGGNYW